MKTLFLFIVLSFSSILNFGQSCPANYNTTLATPDLRQWNPDYTYSILYDEFNGSILNSSWGVRTGCVRNTNEEAQPLPTTVRLHRLVCK